MATTMPLSWLTIWIPSISCPCPPCPIPLYGFGSNCRYCRCCRNGTWDRRKQHRRRRSFVFARPSSMHVPPPCMQLTGQGMRRWSRSSCFQWWLGWWRIWFSSPSRTRPASPDSSLFSPRKVTWRCSCVSCCSSRIAGSSVCDLFCCWVFCMWFSS